MPTPNSFEKELSRGDVEHELHGSQEHQNLGSILSRWMTGKEMYFVYCRGGDGSRQTSASQAQRANSCGIEAEVGIACRPIPGIQQEML